MLVPVPLNATLTVGFTESLLVTAKLPLLVPLAVGEKVTPTCADCPAASVVGVVIPLTLKSAPVRARREIVRLDAPVFVNIRLFVVFTPVETLPKLIVVGLTESCGCKLTPVADKFTATGVLPPSACAVNVAVSAPAVVGVTEIAIFEDWPTARPSGVVPAIVK